MQTMDMAPRCVESGAVELKCTAANASPRRARRPNSMVVAVRVLVLRGLLVLGGMFALGRVFVPFGVVRMMRMIMPRVGGRAAVGRRMVAWMLGIVVVACHALMGAPHPAISRVPRRRPIVGAANVP